MAGTPLIYRLPPSFRVQTVASVKLVDLPFTYNGKVFKVISALVLARTSLEK